MWRLFATLDTPVVLVIDDAHHAGPALADSVLADLIERPFPTLRIILAGRGQPPLLRRRPDHEQSSISAVDLNFTEGEIAALRAVTPRSANPEAAEQIFDATGGWALAVRLILDRAPGARSSLSSPSDTFRLTDYVADHVLAQLRPDLADFILATTTSSRLDAVLATALTGRSDAELLLRECVDTGLFLDRYVDSHNRSIYRWHSVFASHCRIILSRDDTAQADNLCRVAAEHVQSQYPLKAVTLALRGKDPQYAAQVIHTHWLDLVVTSQADVLEMQCLSLPAPWRDSAMICAVRACVRDVLGDRTGASMLFDQARAAMARDPAVAESLTLVTAISELLLADSHPQLIATCDTVSRLLRGSHELIPTTYSCAVFLLGWTELRLRRDPDQAIRLLSTAVRECQVVGQVTIARRASANLRFALAFKGDFNAAMALDPSLTDGPDDNHWDIYDAGIEPFSEGFVHYWRNDLEQSDKKLQQVILSSSSDAPYADLARVHRAFIASTAGNSDTLDSAEAELASVNEAEAHGVPWLIYKQIAQAKIAEARGHSDLAVAIANGIANFQYVPAVAAMVGELHRRTGDDVRAVELVAPLTNIAAPNYVRVSAMVTLALIRSSRGESVPAHQILEESLDIAEPQAILRPYVEGHKDLRDLLAAHSRWGSKHTEFLGAALASSSEISPHHHLSGHSLSRRELEVLGYLRTNMTTVEIAKALFVSVNTIKSQKSSLYRKLGVTNRKGAVAIRIWLPSEGLTRTGPPAD
nr:LuxR C-terminal-related transcriptional regulator [Rhodococcus sp. OK302]